MKKQTLYCIAVSVLFLFFGRLTASALSIEHLVTVQVPFEFQVNEKMLPAGKYLIKRDQQNPQILVIECPEQNIWVTIHILQHRLSEQHAQTSLIFNEYEGKHFLSEVKILERGDRFTLIKSKTERRLAQVAKEKSIQATRATSNSTAAKN